MITCHTCDVFRFESLQIKLDEREKDKMWLVKHLERTRQTMVEDLIVIKVLSVLKQYTKTIRRQS